MSNAQNKVKYNLKNVYYSLLTEANDGTVTFGSPKRFPGAVSLSLEPEGENEPFYADGISYYIVNSNNGYSGDFEMARVVDDFKIDVLGYELDDNDVLVEVADTETKKFALLFQFDGDKYDVRHVMYNCTCERPNTASQTKEENIEVQTETVTITAKPIAVNDKFIVKAETTADTNATAYEDWFETVYTPVSGS